MADIIPAYCPGDEYYAFSWFEERPLGAVSGRLELPGVSAHGSRLIALRKVTGVPRLISTSTHMTQGAVDLCDINWDASAKSLRVTVCHFVQDDEKLFLAAPAGWTIRKVETNAIRHSVDDFDPCFPTLRYQGAAGKRTTFGVFWNAAPGI